MMIDRAFLERELAGLIVQKHQIDGAIQTVQQLLQVLEGAGKPAAPDGLTLEELESQLPAGHVIDKERGVQPHED